MTGLKNIDRSLKRMARKHAREAANALKNVRANKTAMADKHLREQVLNCQRYVDHLMKMMKEVCQYCGAKIPFGCTLCAGCADERGP